MPSKTTKRPTLTSLRCRMGELADPEVATASQWFFKTGPGEYGEGDRFIGIRVPMLRKLAREHRDLPRRDVLKLLHSPIHEQRAVALLILVAQYERGDKATRQEIYELYLGNLQQVNNWDLVDCSAHKIVGEHLALRSKRPLHRLARSRVLWERRVAIIATLTYIRVGAFDETFTIAEMLLDDQEDLIHKAVGWMLREVANRDRAAAEAFLRPRYKTMPRTMLRYAIERFPERRRKQYLAGRV